MRRLAVIICSLLLTLAAHAQDASVLLPFVTAESGGPEGFVITFSIPPASITLGTAYAGPADPAKALYDSGDGVWHSYTGKTIPVVGEYVAFKGDWRTASGTYQNLFYGTFKDTPYSCSFSGSFEHAATAANAYNSMFRDCNKVVAIHDNPLPPIIGTPASYYMFAYACSGMSGVTGSLPEGFMDTSGLTGSPAASMFFSACRDMSGVKNLPEGFMDTSGLTGSPAATMFGNACRNMSGVTSLPEGFMDTSGLTGSPAINMFYGACYNMSGVTNSYVFNISSNVALTANNVTGPFNNAFEGMSKWTGTVMWGTNVLFEAITPAERTRTILNCTQIPGYAGFDANWK